jgi:glycosyltransferase involved in cell wall biosynthesis
MEDKKPVVSFIIPCFNQAEFLYEAVSSVMLSYSGPKEIFILDDCSTDPLINQKLEAIERIFPLVKIIKQEINKGLSVARNLGIELCTGDYIQFLDADDLLIPGKIDIQIEHFRITNAVDISITDYLYSDAILAHFDIPEPCIDSFKLSLDDFLYKWERGLSIPIHCALFKYDVIRNLRFEETLRAKEDWVFWFQHALSRRKISYINIIGAIYRLHPVAMTKSKHGEMGKMWIKASIIIDDLLDSKDNTFMNNALSWYESHYKELIDTTITSPENSIKKKAENNHDLMKMLNIPYKRKILNNLGVKEVLISIVIPVYNHYEYLSKCFESIITQSFEDYEIICINDNSSDPRVNEMLKSLASSLSNLKLLHNERNEGIALSLNKGVNHSNGSYIAFLDCDDYLAPGALGTVKKYIQENPDVDYFFTDKIDIDEEDQFIRIAYYGGYSYIKPSSSVEDDLLVGMVASHLKVIKKEKIEEVGGCDLMLNGVQDYDLALKISGRGKFKYINKPLYYHRQHTSSITTTDTVSQFRKQNIARRNYCERVFRKNNDPFKGITYFKECIINNIGFSPDKLMAYGISLFNAENITLKKLKEDMKSEKTCILDARVDFDINLKYFLREYNSYLDLILTDNPQLAASIIGFLWDYAILWMPAFLKNSNEST